MAGAVGLAGALLAAGAVIAQADNGAPQARAAAGGTGVSLTPQTVQHVSKNGELGKVTIKNTTANRMKVTVVIRPWIQNRGNGLVVPNLRSSMSRYIKSYAASFTLAPGQRTVHIRQIRTPKGGFFYGAVDVFARPINVKARNGIIPQYRIDGRIRVTPRRPNNKLSAGAIVLNGKGNNRSLALPTRNTGNTVDPIGGSVAIQGPTSRTNKVPAVSIIPGQVVNLNGGSLKGLKKGNYTAVWTITQGKKKTTVRRTFKL